MSSSTVAQKDAISLETCLAVIKARCMRKQYDHRNDPLSRTEILAVGNILFDRLQKSANSALDKRWEGQWRVDLDKEHPTCGPGDDYCVIQASLALASWAAQLVVDHGVAPQGWAEKILETAKRLDRESAESVFGDDH